MGLCHKHRSSLENRPAPRGHCREGISRCRGLVTREGQYGMGRPFLSIWGEYGTTSKGLRGGHPADLPGGLGTVSVEVAKPRGRTFQH